MAPEMACSTSLVPLLAILLAMVALIKCIGVFVILSAPVLIRSLQFLMIALSIVKRKVNNSTLEKKMNIKLLTAQQVRNKLVDRRLSYVAEKCGLTYMSLSRLRKNEGNPSLLTLEKLSEYFHKNK